MGPSDTRPGEPPRVTRGAEAAVLATERPSERGAVVRATQPGEAVFEQRSSGGSRPPGPIDGKREDNRFYRRTGTFIVALLPNASTLTK